jgi:AcrR family transcriptional regulator
MKQNIINEAIPLFIQFGFKSVTIDDIAIKMGVSKNNLCPFPKKSDACRDKCIYAF